LLEEELKALSNRDLFVRRGRNNRVFAKFIKREIFRDPREVEEPVQPENELVDHVP
jgi:hypothetical protein